MAGKQIFDVESDEDSIATDSTVDSDAQDIYEVEKILAEERNIDTGTMEYLVKWAGYPLDQCTWEPKENFESDGIMDEWNNHKQLIREGKGKAFNVDEFETAVENRLAAQEDRMRRRKIKRKKRGIPVSAHESDAESLIGAQGSTSAKTKSTPVKQPIIKRKGVAQKLEKRRAEKSASASTSSESSVSYDDSSGNDSMVEELISKVSNKIPSPRPQKSPYKGTAVISRDQPTNSGPLVAKAVQPQPTASSAARKSAPSTGGIGKAKRTTGKDLSKKWAERKERNKQTRVSGDTARDWTQPRFTHLSVQNRFQKFSRNEPAPDVSVLKVVDPKTGKVQPPKNGVAAPAQAIHSAYHRRTPTPETQRRSTISPSPEPAPFKATSANALPVRSTSYGTTVPPIEEPYRVQQETCRYWLRGVCKYSTDTCRWAHWHIGAETGKALEEPTAKVAEKRAGKKQDLSPHPGVYPPGHVRQKDMTCHFWRRGYCHKSEEQCVYAHRNTGLDAPPPGASRKGSKRGTSDAYVNTFASGAYDSAFPAAHLQGAAPTNAASNGRDIASAGRPPTLQTDVNLSRDSNGSPMHLTNSPVQVHLAQAEVARDSPPKPRAFSIPPSRRPSAPALTMKAKLELSKKDGQRPSLLQVQLEINDFGSVTRLIGDQPHLKLEQMIMATDFEAFLWDHDLRASDSLPGGIIPEAFSLSESQSLIELCKLHGCALIARTEARDSRMVLYPTGAEEWKFLDQSSIPLTTDSILQFRLFDRLPGTEVQWFESSQKLDKPVDMRPYATIIAEDLACLERKRLLPKDIRDVFVMMPTTRLLELELYTKIFQSMGCKVYHSCTPGAWAFFCKRCRAKSLVVIHPDIPAWQIPGLHEILFSSGSVVFFSLGVDRRAAFLEDRPATLGCTRIFPHGTVVFITDDVLQYHPEKATAIIHNFLELHNQKPEGADYSRLAARPGLKDFVFRLAEEKGKDRGRTDNRWLDLYDAVCVLFPPDAEDLWNPGNPLPTSNLVSISPDLLPSFEGLWEKDELAATDFMVEWFAGWCAMNASRYRKFIVCHEPNHNSTEHAEEIDPLGWAKKYQHLGVMSANTVTSKVFYQSAKKKPHR